MMGRKTPAWRVAVVAAAILGVSAAGVTAWAAATDTDVGAAVAGWFGSTLDTTAPLGSGEARVVRVVDGDTLVVATESDPELTVRVLGVDTPETVKPDTPVECYGPEASEFVHELLPSGTIVGLATDLSQPATDKYGRALRHVFLIDPDGNHRLLSLELIEAGYATKYTAAPTDWDQILTAAEATAKQDRLGLWGACPNPN